jgi:hypothetical protein
VAKHGDTALRDEVLVLDFNIILSNPHAMEMSTSGISLKPMSWSGARKEPLGEVGGDSDSGSA